MKSVLRIGGASGFWGEADYATAQLLEAGVDVLVYDYLAEITLSILARARAGDPGLGYATDFVSDAMVPNLTQIAASGTKVLSNAGGMNPTGCAQALRSRIAEAGLTLRVAVVEGDDLLPRADEFQEYKEMFSGAPMPPRDRVMSVNAYLGAGPIIAALQAGADIVLTGRCVDSALALAACVHRFGWAPDDFDRLAAGSLAGHLLECGPQATGGNFTDWQLAGDISRIGYPVAEVAADGTVTVTKPETSEGLVSVATVAEQMLYEIGDPQNYALPDVICDLTQVRLNQCGPDRVEVTGAKGRAPTGRLKVSATCMDGYRGGMVFQMNGTGARAKAQAFAQAGLDRARGRLDRMQLQGFRSVEFEGFGGRPGVSGYEEIAFKAAVRHDDARGISVFLKELTGAALAAPPGLHFFTGAGRPKPSPVVALFSFLVNAADAPAQVSLDGRDIPVDWGPPSDPGAKPPPAAQPPGPTHAGEIVNCPLERLVWARSGDKGDSANIGVIPRDADLMPHIWAGLTPDRIADIFAEALQGEVHRYYLPGLPAMNIVMTRVLGGGGVVSLRNDPQGKAFAQRLLAQSIPVPAGLVPGGHDGD